ncbi:hypothetical protein [Salinisphaera sp. T5B8]|uniref:hypothetical protein n=1 Tax=Salinisphaera sp. T5B8 TaxID=1304154 RepID=UPI00333E9043
MFAANDDNPAGTSRYALYALAALCLILIGYAALRSVELIGTARSQALADAERAIAAATATHIRQDRVPDALIVAAESLLGEPQLGLNYVTVRNAQNVTLVSRGRFSGRFEFLGTGTARSLRSWDYRLESAEATQAIRAQDEGGVIGFAQFGVDWFHVFASAGVGLIIWLTALLAGLVGFFGALVASTSTREQSPAPSTSDTPGRIRKPAPQASTATDTARAPLSRLARRRGRKASEDEFEPIVSSDNRAAGKPAQPITQGEPDRPQRAEPPPIRQPQRPAPANETPAPGNPSSPTRAPAAAAQAQPKSAEPKQPEPKQPEPKQPEPKQAEPSVQPPPSQPAVQKSAPSRQRTPGKDAPAQASKPAPQRRAAVAAPVETELHAPRLDAEPRLGDATLDLRFYPIWRDAKREVLAGACAALAWRTPETRLVDADTLTRLAEQKGALRAFTQWIARRFSLLHSNWRTLEINTVPIVLPIPSAMLAFADAEAVWRDALRRTDRDPNDLILRLLSTRMRRGVHSSLPVRRALTLAGYDKPVPADCDIACVDAADVGPDSEQWFACIEQLQCPVLLGPIDDPEPYTRLINHNRVLWFSDDEQALYSPRAFARLLTRCSTQPI